MPSETASECVRSTGTASGERRAEATHSARSYLVPP